MSIVTEKEAAAKWCPLTFNSESFEMCSGSKCMAWQWHKTNVKVADLSQEDRDHHGTALAVFSDVDLVSAWRTYGFCGAFRKVEP